MSKECSICYRSQDDADHDKSVVYSDEYWVVRHSPETNITGYVVIEPRRHFLDMSHATPQEIRAYGNVLAAAMKAVRDVTECERIYTFSLGESVSHYHLHVIPRRKDFPRAYRARGIMQYPLVPAVDENILEFVCERLRRAMSRAHALT